MSECETLYPSARRRRAAQFVTRPLLCMCVRYEAVEAKSHWGPCPSSLCQRRSHALVHRVATSGRDFRYGGFRAWLRWVVRGVPADAEDA